MSKSITQLEAEISDKAGDVSQWRRLLDDPVWKMLAETFEAQIRERTNAIVFTPLESVDGAMKQEFMKGEVGGLGLASKLPVIMLEAAQLDLDRLNEELKGLSNVQKDTPPVGGVDGHAFG